MSKKYRFLLGCKYILLIESLKAVIKDHDDIHIVATSHNVDDCLHHLIRRKPDVALVDIDLPGRKSTIEIISQTKKRSLPTKIVLLSEQINSFQQIHQFILQDIHGIILYTECIENLPEIIRQVHYGEEYYSREVYKEIIKIVRSSDQNRTNPVKKLSKREIQILEYLTQGLSSREIANKLKISERTVSNHRSNMIKKTDSKSTIELVKFYLNYDHQDLK
jgi:DNA-binding NarL/FixJ family response regulator